ncbi:MAG: hypothetical protein HY403_03090 [Elusimicrobia bacterium]|nr:hypothetical protein [Elusimicrobiota bacterium]
MSHLAAVLTLGLLASPAGAEEIRLITTYPAPSGTYTQLMTTGLGNRDTILCRDDGTVRVGVRGLESAGVIASSGNITSGGEITAARAVRVGNLSSDPAGGRRGMIYYNTTLNKFRGFVNGSWVDLVAATASNPAICVPNGSCGAPAPACGAVSYGVDNCGTHCTKVGGACACVSNGSCSAPNPACETTTNGVDNCGNPCSRVGGACACVSNGSCSAVPLNCGGGIVSGVDNCGTVCYRQAPTCQCTSGNRCK